MEAMLLSVLLFLCSGILQAQRIIDTEYGQVRGHLVNVNNGVEQTTVEVFYGIPFAKDTSGPRRFSVSFRAAYEYTYNVIVIIIILRTCQFFRRFCDTVTKSTKYRKHIPKSTMTDTFGYYIN